MQPKGGEKPVEVGRQGYARPFTGRRPGRCREDCGDVVTEKVIQGWVIGAGNK